MKTLSRFSVIDAMVILSIAAYAGFRMNQAAPSSEANPTGWAAAVSLQPLFKTAVQADGRLRSFASHAKTYMGLVSGPRTVGGQSHAFAYLDLMFRPERYLDEDIIYIKNKVVRSEIVETARAHGGLDADRAARIQKIGLVSKKMLRAPVVITLLQRLGKDLIRTSKAVDAIQSAMTVSDSRFLLNQLRMLPPPGGAEDKPWLSPNEWAGARESPADDVHAGLSDASAIPGLDPAIQRELADTWATLRTSWRQEDAAAVNTAIERLAALITTVAPQHYPSTGRLAMESWYFRNKSMTWVWLVYLVGVVPLLMAVVYHWDRARAIGMIAFAVAFGFHTASLIIRWYISGRWPNSNMFEALTTSAWFGGVAALILERITRRTPFRNLFALGSSLVSMAALMAAYFLPAQLNSAIGNKMAALNDVWLYIHTNMIIWSYAVIGLACVPALLLLRHRWCRSWDRGTIPRMRLLILPIALAVLNYTAYLLLMHAVDDAHHGLGSRTLPSVVAAFWGSMMVVLLEAFAARSRRAGGDVVERSASGGASALILGSSRGSSFLKPGRPSAAQVYDGATMVLVELSFFMLWVGVVMGAIWADHSWGRPWGWDPKEVFALNTFIIFLVLIHVRLKVLDKAFWTAVLAVVGFEVMLFNWIVVNFVISGLHSYA